MSLKIDLHVHTTYSRDSTITPRDLLAYTSKRGLDGVALVDHDKVAHPMQINKRSDLLVILGTEVSSAHGHIIGLNVSKEIPPKLDVGDTLDRIHEAEGIAVASHPMAFFKKSLKQRIDSRFDAIEVINSLAFPFRYSVRWNEKIASRFDIPRVAGSDAHYGPEIGYAYTLVEADMNVDEVIEALRKGRCTPYGKAVPMTMRIRKEMALMRRRLQRL